MDEKPQTLSKGMDSFIVARDFLAVLAKLGLGYNSKQLFFTLLSRVNAKNDDVFNWYNVDIKSFEMMTGGNHKNPSESFDIALEQLGSKVYYHDPVAKRKLRTMLVDSDYYYGEGRAEVRFSDKMKPFLLQVKALSGYLKGSVDYCLEQRSSYAVLGYFLLMSKVVWNKGVEENEVVFLKDEFVDFLNIPISSQRTDHLKKRVIEPIVNGMNDSVYSTIAVDWEWEKRGVRIHAIRFTLRKKTVIDMTPRLFDKDGSVLIETEEVEVKPQLKKKGKLREWFTEKAGYTDDQYTILVEIAENQLEKANQNSPIEAFMKDFKWWSETKNDPISYRTFYIMISAVHTDYNLVEQWLRELSSAQAGSFARQGAIVDRIKKTIIKTGRNVGKETEDFRASFLPFE